MDLKLKLDAQDWTERTPTQSQIITMLDEHSKFLGALAGILLATGEYSISEQPGPPETNPVAQLLYSSGQLKRTKDCFAGTSTSGIVTPQPQPQMMPRR